MFATKQCAESWIKDYGKGKAFEAKRWGKHWAIYDGHYRLEEEELFDIEVEHEAAELRRKAEGGENA